MTSHQDQPALEIASEADVPFLVTHSRDEQGRPLVSFRAAGENADGTPKSGGASYFYSTLAGTDRNSVRLRERGQGLILHGAVPSWNISGETMDQVMDWLLVQLGRPPVELYVVDDLPF